MLGKHSATEPQPKVPPCPFSWHCIEITDPDLEFWGLSLCAYRGSPIWTVYTDTFQVPSPRIEPKVLHMLTICSLPRLLPPNSSSILSFAFYKWKIPRSRAGEKAQCLGMSAALSRTEVLFLAATLCSTISCNFSSGESDALLWFLKEEAIMWCTYIYEGTSHILYIYNKTYTILLHT